jgi:putative ABC transport system ATP-binding protein
MPDRAGAPARMTSPPVLRTEKLTRAVDDRLLVDGVSIDVHERDVLAVVGPSGSGKSSFLRLLNRLDEPTGGTVFLDGVDTATLPPRELRRRVGMVMQAAALFPGTVADNVRFGPRQRGVEPPDAVVAELLAQVGLAGFEERSTAQLSGGEAQRVSIARAVANEPRVLLLDEPTSALDPRAKRDVEALVRDVVRARGLTCVIVTHDLAQAARIANRVLELVAGRAHRVGPVRDLLRDEYEVRGAAYDLP